MGCMCMHSNSAPVDLPDMDTDISGNIQDVAKACGQSYVMSYGDYLPGFEADQSECKNAKSDFQKSVINIGKILLVAFVMLICCVLALKEATCQLIKWAFEGVKDAIKAISRCIWEVIKKCFQLIWFCISWVFNGLYDTICPQTPYDRTEQMMHSHPHSDEALFVL